MDTLARSISMLLIALGKMTDADLAKINQLAQQSTDVHFTPGHGPIPVPSGGGQGYGGGGSTEHTDWNAVAKKIGSEVYSSFLNTNFSFIFKNNTGGVIILKK
jgi:hypothetical protein